MRILMTRVGGQLGHDVINELEKRGIKGMGSDITDRYAVFTEVIPVTTEEYGISKAARPFNSRLDRSKLIENGFGPLPTWQDALKRYLDEIAN